MSRQLSDEVWSMVSTGTVLFVRFPDDQDAERLYRGRTVGSDTESFLAQFPEDLPCLVTARADIHYRDRKHKFVKVAATVQQLLPDQPHCLIRFATVEQPEAADKRNFFRVSVVALKLTADIGDASGCAVLDVGLEGFCAITPTSVAIGEVLFVQLHYQGGTCSGRARICSIQAMDDGTSRCGLQAESDESPLLRSLESIALSVQRAQLRCRSRLGRETKVSTPIDDPIVDSHVDLENVGEPAPLEPDQPNDPAPKRYDPLADEPEAEVAIKDLRSRERAPWVLEATVQVLSTTDRRRLSVSTRDLSTGGFSFYADSFVHVDVPVRLEVQVKGEIHQFTGEVVYCNIISAPLHCVGVRFIESRVKRAPPPLD